MLRLMRLLRLFRLFRLLRLLRLLILLRLLRLLRSEKSITHSVSDNLKTRDASASKNFPCGEFLAHHVCVGEEIWAPHLGKFLCVILGGGIIG